MLYVKAKGLMWTPEVMWQASIADLELAAVDSYTNSSTSNISLVTTQIGHNHTQTTSGNTTSHIDEEGGNSGSPEVATRREDNTESNTNTVLASESTPRHIGSSHTASCTGQRVRFVAQQVQKAIRAGAVSAGKVGIPFSFLLVQCIGREEAKELVDAVTGLMRESDKGCIFIGKTQCIFSYR